MSNWVKEELTTREEISEALDWIKSSCYYIPPYDADDEKIITDIFEKRNHKQMNNPCISYTWYLIIEALFIEPHWDDFIRGNEDNLPLWIYHNSHNIRIQFDDYDTARWYWRLIESDELNLLGEFGEFVSWLKKYLSRIRWYFSDEALLDEIIEEVLICPDWEEIIGDSQEWNHRYTLEDWIYHDVV